MSEERELLKKCLGTFQTINVWDDCLIKEIIGLLAQPETEQLTPRQGLTEYKKGYKRGYDAAVRDLKQKVDSVFNLIVEEDDE